MPSTGEGHISPRDAIREWLLQAEHDGDNNPKEQRNSARNVTTIEDEKGSDRRPRRASPERTAANLAESLGLQRPFRTLGFAEDRGDHRGYRRGHGHKRRRRSASESSYLEPAMVAPTDRRIRDSDHRIGRHKSKSTSAGGNGAGRGHSASAGSTHSGISSEKPAVTYERRPRRKTREDRYEPKRSSKNEKGKSQNDVKRPSKRKRGGKTRAKAAYDYDAESNAGNRLTLKRAHGLGFFKKGRASSPIRRGVPDLAFSEMTFLASRREKSKELSNLAKGRKDKDKAAGDEDEISRFFNTGKQVLLERDINLPDKQPIRAARPSHRAHGHAKRTSPGISAQRQSSYPSVELPEKPFLGFGKSGATPLPSLELRDPLTKTDHSVAQAELVQHTPGRSTTYYTWSRSGTGSIPLKQKRHRPVPSLGLPAASAALNPATPLIEVGQLSRGDIPELRPADMQAMLSHERPYRHCSSAEGPDRSRDGVAGQPLHSRSTFDAHTPMVIGDACKDTESPTKLVTNEQGEAEQQSTELPIASLENIGQGISVISAHPQDVSPHSKEHAKRLQDLESLLHACKTTLSELRPTLGGPPPSRTVNEPVQLDTARLNDSLSMSDVRSEMRTCMSQGVADIKRGALERVHGGSRKDMVGLPEQKAAGGPALHTGGVSESEPITRHTNEPPSMIYRNHIRQNDPRRVPTDFSQEIAELRRHNLQDTRTLLADYRFSNPHQSSGVAYCTADPQQNSVSFYEYPHSSVGERCGMGELESWQHTPLRLDNWQRPNSDHQLDHPRRRNAHRPSRTRVVQSEGFDNAAQDILDHDFLRDIEMQAEHQRDSFAYDHDLISPVNYPENQDLWADGSLDDSLEISLHHDLSDERPMNPTSANHERRANQTAPGIEIDEMPMTSFWRPHRLY